MEEIRMEEIRMEEIKPLVSCVVTVCGNHLGRTEQELAAIVKQLREQTYKQIEIIPIACCFQEPLGMESLLGLSLINLPHVNPHGQYFKNDLGVSLAKGKYIGFFSGDDTYSSDYLEKMVSLAEKEGVSIVYCNFRSHYAQGQEVNGFIEMGHITNGSFLIRADIAKEVCHFPRTGTGDIEFLQKALEKGATSAKVNETLYTHI